MHRTFHNAAASAIVLLTLASCTSMPAGGPDAVHTFADATSATGPAVSAAFETVNASYYAAQGASYLAQFNRGSGIPELTDFLPPAAIATRVAVFDSLAAYAALLVDIADNDKSAELGTASGALAESLQGFRAEGASDLSAGVASGVHGIGKLFTNGRRFRGISEAAREADPHVQQLCALLASDIVALRGQLAADNAKTRQEELRYLKDSLAAEKTGGAQIVALDAATRRGEIERLVHIARDGKAADKTLAELSTMVGDLAAAHEALADAYGNSASALQKSQSFLARAQRLRQRYLAPITPQRISHGLYD